MYTAVQIGHIISLYMLRITLYYAPYCIPQGRCTKCFSHFLLGCRGGDTEKVLESECVFIRQGRDLEWGCLKLRAYGCEQVDDNTTEFSGVTFLKEALLVGLPGCPNAHCRT